MKYPIVRDIDVTLARTFVSVVETGSMTAAANTQNLTQAAVSQQMKRLEELFGEALFDRSQRQATLTSTGQNLLPHAKRLVRLNDEIWSSMTGPQFEGEIRMGVPHDIFQPFMPVILRTFCKAWPGINLVLHSSSTAVLKKELDEGQLDLVLTTEHVPARDMLIADRLVWAGMKDGQAFQQNPLPVALGHDDCAFKSHVLEALSEEGREWKLTCHVGSNDPIISILEADLGVAPFMALTVPPQLEIIPSHGGLPELPHFFINMYVKPGQKDAPVIELAQHVRNGFAARYSNVA